MNTLIVLFVTILLIAHSMKPTLMSAKKNGLETMIHKWSIWINSTTIISIIGKKQKNAFALYFAIAHILFYFILLFIITYFITFYLLHLHKKIPSM